MQKSKLVSKDMNFINCNKTVTRGHLLFKAGFVGALCFSFWWNEVWNPATLVSGSLHKKFMYLAMGIVVKYLTEKETIILGF